MKSFKLVTIKTKPFRVIPFWKVAKRDKKYDYQYEDLSEPTI